MKRFSKIAISLLMAFAIVFSSFAVGVFNIGSVVAEAASVEYGTTYGTLKYETEGSTATVIGIATTNVKEDIKIPEKIKINNVEYTVTAIAAEAFDGEAITSVIVPKTVVSIGEKAFFNCASLASVTLETKAATNQTSDLESIGEHAFDGCSSLAEIVIPAGVKTIDKNAFANCTKLNKVTYAVDVDKNLSISSIGSYAFFKCSALTEVNLPDSLNVLGTYAFQYCTAVETVVIGKNIQSISASAFQGCTSLNSVTLDKDLNQSNENSKLFSIDAKAFQGCTSLTEVKIPHFVTKIDALAFDGCEALAAVYIPDSVESIGEKAFNNCGKLADVYYEGTEDEYNAIVVGEYNEVILDKATLHTESYDHVHKLEKNEELSFDATCTKGGELHQYCECVYEEMSPIPPKGHTKPDANEDGTPAYTIDKAATCEADGSKSLHCTVCNAIIEETVVVIDATGHTWSASKKVTKAATCTAKGEKAIVCENEGCGIIKEGTKEEIKAKGHSYAKDFTVDKEPTCTAAGSKSKHCANCSAKTEVTTIPAKGHSYGAWVVTKAATKTEAGAKERKCACGHVEKAVIPATAPKSITILPGDVSLNKDQTTVLTVEAGDNDIIWVSSNPSIASVDDNGKVTAHKKGVVTITATVADTTVYDTCTVTVTYTFFQMIASFFSGIIDFIFGFLN